MNIKKNLIDIVSNKLVEFVQMMIREALNSALDEELAADSRVFLMGEEVG